MMANTAMIALYDRLVEVAMKGPTCRGAGCGMDRQLDEQGGHIRNNHTDAESSKVQQAGLRQEDRADCMAPSIGWSGMSRFWSLVCAAYGIAGPPHLPLAAPEATSAGPAWLSNTQMLEPMHMQTVQAMCQNIIVWPRSG